MHDEPSFLQAMLDAPEDVALRLVFADWLEERGDPRSELLRVLTTLTESIEVPDRSRLEDRLRGLLESGVQPVGPCFTNSVGMKFAFVPPGEFLMGSPPAEEERLNNETQHRVTLTKAYFLAVHPVTQACWQTLMGTNPSEFQGDDLPVEQVSWDDCQEFLRQLSQRDGHAYRLPTEAEWERACRAATTTPFSFGPTISPDQVNYHGYYRYGKARKGKYRKKTTPAGGFPPNAWGLYDMHGNVWEWCSDWYGDYVAGNQSDPEGSNEEDARVVRGGSWTSDAGYCRAAYRGGAAPAATAATDGNSTGFRVCFRLD